MQNQTDKQKAVSKTADFWAYRLKENSVPLFAINAFKDQFNHQVPSIVAGGKILCIHLSKDHGIVKVENNTFKGFQDILTQLGLKPELFLPQTKRNAFIQTVSNLDTKHIICYNTCKPFVHA